MTTTVSSTQGVSGASAVAVGSTAPQVSVMSSDAILAFCQNQLSEIDGQITNEVSVQETAIHEQNVLGTLQSVVAKYGDKGPQTYGEQQDLSDAFDAAISALPTTDPLRDKLALNQKSVDSVSLGNPPTYIPPSPPLPQNAPAIPQVSQPPQTHKATDQLGSTWGATEWKSITTDVSNYQDQAKSGSELQMLTIQNLVSSREQAAAEASAMLTKMDQTDEDLSKNV